MRKRSHPLTRNPNPRKKPDLLPDSSSASCLSVRCTPISGLDEYSQPGSGQVLAPVPPPATVDGPVRRLAAGGTLSHDAAIVLPPAARSSTGHLSERTDLAHAGHISTRCDKYHGPQHPHIRSVAKHGSPGVFAVDAIRGDAAQGFDELTAGGAGAKTRVGVAAGAEAGGCRDGQRD
jgi:hypothetical protein